MRSHRATTRDQSGLQVLLVNWIRDFVCWTWRMTRSERSSMALNTTWRKWRKSSMTSRYGDSVQMASAPIRRRPDEMQYASCKAAYTWWFQCARLNVIPWMVRCKESKMGLRNVISMARQIAKKSQVHFVILLFINKVTDMQVKSWRNTQITTLCCTQNIALGVRTVAGLWQLGVVFISAISILKHQLWNNYLVQ